MGVLDNLFGQFNAAPEDASAVINPAAMGQPEPQVDPREEMLRSLGPMIQAMQGAATNTPQMREEELYKKKMKEMFGVKLGEKNPKWRSVLRGVFEGMDALGAGYHHSPTIREKAGIQARKDYEQENAVLGKEGMGAIGNIVRSIGQDKTAQTAAAKLKAREENDSILNSLKGRKLDQEDEKILIAADKAKALGNFLEERALLMKVQQKAAMMTPDMKLAEGLTQNPELGNVLNRYRSQGAYMNQLGKNAAGGSRAGGGGGSTTTTTRQVANEATGLYQPETTISVRQPSGGTVDTGAAKAEAEKLGIIPGLTTPGPVSPGAPTSSGAAPQVSDASPGTPTGPLPVPIPKAPPKSVFTQKIPGNSSLKDAASKIETRLKDGDLARFTPTAGKKYQELMGVAEDVAGINDAIWGAGTKFDKAGQSVADRYSGFMGKLLNLGDRASGDLKTSAQFFKEVNDRATNSYRHMITGAGAGWKEIDYLKSRYPTWGDQFTIDDRYTTLKKSLVLHFMAQKQLWNFQHRGTDPKEYGKFFNERDMENRVDTILNDYKQLEKVIPGSPESKRKVLTDEFREKLFKNLDAQEMFDSGWRQFKNIAPARKGKRVVIE